MTFAPLAVVASRPALAELIPFIVGNLGAAQLREMDAKLKLAKRGANSVASAPARVDPYWGRWFRMMSLHISLSELKVSQDVRDARAGMVVEYELGLVHTWSMN